jgi:Protein of unknown function (DUF1501)
MNELSRRRFLKGMAVAAGAAAGTRVAGSGWMRDARADLNGEKSAVVCIFLLGGYNSLFPSAGSFMGNGAFGVNAGNVSDLGNGLIVDKGTLGSVPAFAQTHMASIGVRHGISDHGQANTADWSDGSRSYPLMLAAALGGEASIKAAAVGEKPQAPLTAEGGVSMQQILDMSSTIQTLQGGDPKAPRRDLAAKGLATAQGLSNNRFKASPDKLVDMKDGYGSAIATLQKPIPPFDFSSLPGIYGSGTQVDQGAADFKARMAAAELMVRAGSNVVTVYSRNEWDSHGDSDGSSVRSMFTGNVAPALNMFLDRTLVSTDLATTHNVVTMIFGDFARSLPGSDHQPNLTATVMGKYVKGGTTGAVDGAAALAAGTPSVAGLWSYLAAVSKCPGVNPFGANPHNLVIP